MMRSPFERRNHSGNSHISYEHAFEAISSDRAPFRAFAENSEVLLRDNR